MQTGCKRDWAMDNLRCMLIFCVVFTHLLETCSLPYGNLLHRIINQFHMPCFMFISGYFARESPSPAAIGRLILRYILFQTVYLIFGIYVLREDIAFQYTRPYMLLWYALSLVFCNCFLAVCPLPTGKRQICAILGTQAVSLLAGFDESVERWLSLSRTLGYLPFFLLGFWFRREQDAILRFFRRCPLPWVLTVFAGLFLGIVSAFDVQLPTTVLQRSVPYAAGVVSLLQRIAVNGISLCWIAALLLLFRKFFSRSIPLVSRIGANTLPVYLLHGFLSQYLRYHPVARFENYPCTVLMSILILLLFGNPTLSRLFSCNSGKKLYNKVRN